MKKTGFETDTNQGSVFVYILIAIALFAGLAYALSRSSGSTVGAASEIQADLKAVEILSYANTVAEATSRVKLRGFSDTELSFENGVIGANPNCADNYCNIFEKEGGGVVYKEPASQWLASAGSMWSVTGNNNVEGIGSDSVPDLVLFLPNVNADICKQINGKLGFGYGDPPVVTANVGLFTEYFTGTYSGTPENLILSPSVNGETAACFEGNSGSSNLASGTYHFYRVLIAR